MSESTAQVEMPRYKCHKEVWALKISRSVKNPNGSVDLFFANEGYAPINVEDQDWINRWKPVDGDEGYLVQYEGGFRSWSPTEAFEGGYTRI